VKIFTFFSKQNYDVMTIFVRLMEERRNSD